MISCSVTHQRLSFPAAISKISTNTHTHTGAKERNAHAGTNAHKKPDIHTSTGTRTFPNHSLTRTHTDTPQQKGSFAATL